MEKYILKNGLIVYYYPIDNAYSTSIGLYINAGSKMESSKQNGITHMLEHIHFRRLEDLDQKELYFSMDKIGANLRAMTHKEYMRFYIKVRPKFFQDAIEIFSKIISMYSWNNEDFEQEKKVVLNELDSKEPYVYQETCMDYLVWGDHPLSMPVIGKRDCIMGLTLEQVIKYKRKIFSEGNVALIITGKVTENNKQNVEKHLGNLILSENVCMGVYPTKVRKSNKCPQIRLELCQWDYVDINLAFSIDNTEKMCELMVLNSILGGGTGAKLQYILRESLGLTYDIYSCVENYMEGSIIKISFTTHKNYIYDCIKSITEVISSIKHEISQSDMDTNLPYFTENLWYWLEDTELLNSEMGWELFRQYEPRTVEERIASYEDVTKEKLMDLARRIFLPQNVSLLISGEVKHITKKGIVQILEKLADSIEEVSESVTK